ncbi:MAG: FAD-binding protein [Gammaproteobacteria bacterium]|nr:MAG: FAD-binding protein [Gammaproteobacteria bacterium]
MDRATLAARLRDILPADAVVAEEEALRPYAGDALTAYRRLPRVVALPRSIEEVQAVMRLCALEGVPVVARGAGTGLSGGALPDESGVLLVLARMNRILDLDPVARTARLEPGVRNLAISEAAAPHGLYYAPDPSSQIACSIGGNVAENSGGVHCLKYGLTVHNLLGVKLITADGELLEIGGAALDAPGLDLLALVTGSEGLLGLVVEVTVRLLPTPAATRVLLAAFDAIDAAADAVAAVISGGIVPAGMEMMDRLAIEAAEDFVAAGYPRDAAAILLCEVDGEPDEVEAQVARVSEILAASGATGIRVARDAAERARFWAGRKAAFPAVGRIAPDYYCMDGTIPRRHLAQVLLEIERLAATFGLAVANVFHAGDGNLHPLILYDANAEGELERAEAFGARILELCVSVGGTITGEHGVGIEKIDQMCVQFSAVELERFHSLKAAFDPNGRLNPGKAVPTLARCAELGGMHVHGGALPHPELERF